MIVPASAGGGAGTRQSGAFPLVLCRYYR
jgi:hypothetical protein